MQRDAWQTLHCKTLKTNYSFSGLVSFWHFFQWIRTMVQTKRRKKIWRFRLTVWIINGLRIRKRQNGKLISLSECRMRQRWYVCNVAMPGDNSANKQIELEYMECSNRWQSHMPLVLNLIASICGLVSLHLRDHFTTYNTFVTMTLSLYLAQVASELLCAPVICISASPRMYSFTLKIDK